MRNIYDVFFSLIQGCRVTDIYYYCFGVKRNAYSVFIYNDLVNFH